MPASGPFDCLGDVLRADLSPSKEAEGDQRSEPRQMALGVGFNFQLGCEGGCVCRGLWSNETPAKAISTYQPQPITVATKERRGPSITAETARPGTHLSLDNAL